MLMSKNFTETYVSLIKLPRRKQTGVGGRYNGNSRKRTLVWKYCKWFLVNQSRLWGRMLYRVEEKEHLRNCKVTEEKKKRKKFRLLEVKNNNNQNNLRTYIPFYGCPSHKKAKTKQKKPPNFFLKKHPLLFRYSDRECSYTRNFAKFLKLISPTLLKKK